MTKGWTNDKRNNNAPHKRSNDANKFLQSPPKRIAIRVATVYEYVLKIISHILHVTFQLCKRM